MLKNINIGVEVTLLQNALVRRLVQNEVAAFKNWIVTAVEQNDMPRAQSLVAEMRDYESLLHVFRPNELIKENQLTSGS